MNITKQSVKFNESDVVSTYGWQHSDGSVRFYDVNLKGKTIREYWCPAGDVDAETSARFTGNFDMTHLSGLTLQQRKERGGN